LLPTLAKCTFNNNNANQPTVGVQVDFSALQSMVGRLDETLFGESHASYLISYAPENEGAIKASLLASGRAGLGLYNLGVVTDDGQLNSNCGSLNSVKLLQQNWELS
jgi:hypothetical protein